MDNTRSQRSVQQICVPSQARHESLNDRRNSAVAAVRFPPTREVLFDNRPTGPAQTVHIGSLRSPELLYKENVIRVAHHYAEQCGDSSYTCTLAGSLLTNTDGNGVSGVTVTVDQFDKSGTDAPGDEELPDTIVVPCRWQKSSKASGTVEDYTNCIKALFERCRSSAGLDLSKFVCVRAHCCQHASQRSYVNVNFDLVCPSTVFSFLPVSPLTICPSALSNQLLKLDTNMDPKTGYLTMVETRKLLFLLDSDPKTTNFPLVGIWLSGVTSQHDLFVWASCLRYMCNASLTDRALDASNGFIVVLITQSRPQFYKVTSQNGKTTLDFILCTASDVIKIPRDGAVNERSPCPLELKKVESGDKQITFQAALESCWSMLSAVPTHAPHTIEQVDYHDQQEKPRPEPTRTPHSISPNSTGPTIPVPSVPDPSLLEDECIMGVRNGAIFPTPPTLQNHYTPIGLGMNSEGYPAMPSPAAVGLVEKTKKVKGRKSGSKKTLTPTGPPPQQQQQQQGYMPPYQPQAQQLNQGYMEQPQYGMSPHPMYPSPHHQMHPQQYQYMNSQQPKFFPPPQPYPQQLPPQQQQYPPHSMPYNPQYNQQQYQQQQPPIPSQIPQQFPAPQPKKTTKKSKKRVSITTEGGDYPVATTPNYVMSTAPNHVMATTPNHVMATAPNHVMATTPNHVMATTPNHVMSSSQHPLDQTALHESPPGVGHDSADSGVLDNSGGSHEDTHNTARCYDSTNVSAQCAPSPAAKKDNHYYKMQEEIRCLKEQIAQLIMHQQLGGAQGAHQATTTRVVDSATQSSQPNSPQRAQQVSMHSIAVNTSLWLGESPHGARRLSQMPSLEETYSDINVTSLNSTGQGNANSVMSEPNLDLPAYTSLSPDKLNQANCSDPQSPILGESVSMYQQQDEHYQQQYEEEEEEDYIENEGEQYEGNEEQEEYEGNEEEYEGNEEGEEYEEKFNDPQYYQKILANMQQFLGRTGGNNDANNSVQSEPVQSYRGQQGDEEFSSSHSLQVYQPQGVRERTKQQLQEMGLFTQPTSSSDSSTRGGSSDNTRYDMTYCGGHGLVTETKYVSMNLTEDHSVDGKLDNVALKYVNDDNLTKLARARKQGEVGNAPIAHLITRSSSSDNTMLSPSKKHMSFATKQYMHRYGLDGSDAQTPQTSQQQQHHGHHDQSYNSDVRRSFNSSTIPPTPQTPRILDVEKLRQLPKLH